MEFPITFQESFSWGRLWKHCWQYLVLSMKALLCQSVKAVKMKKGETDTSLKQMGLDLCLITDQKQKMGCCITCNPFRVYPQEICFSWKRLQSSWQKKPSVKVFEKGTSSLVSLIERAQPGIKAVFPPLVFLDTFFFTKFREYPYSHRLAQKIN